MPSIPATNLGTTSFCRTGWSSRTTSRKPDVTTAEGVRGDPRGPILVGKVEHLHLHLHLLGDDDGRMPCDERLTQLGS